MLLTHKHSSFPGFGFLASAHQEQAAGCHPRADPPDCPEPAQRTETGDERKEGDPGESTWSSQHLILDLQKAEPP